MMRLCPAPLGLSIAASSASRSSSPAKPDFWRCFRSLVTAEMLLFLAWAFSFSLSACVSLADFFASRCLRLHTFLHQGSFNLMDT